MGSAGGAEAPKAPPLNPPLVMERFNDHRHVHNQCARARGCVHVFDFCHDWTKYLQ